MKKILSVTWLLCMLLLFASCATDADTITVISREDGSGTRTAFLNLIGLEDITATAEVSQSTTVVMTSVENNAAAIGYISLGSLNNSVKTLKIGGVEATAENVKNGTYKISRSFYIATKGELDALTHDFISFILSDAGQAVVEDNGYVSVASGTSYTASNVGGSIIITGSSSVKPVMEKLIEAYTVRNPAAVIDLSQSDSGNGMVSVANGTCQIGLSSREVKESELAQGLTATAIAMDGIAVIVNKNNALSDIDIDTLAGIYSGTITAWSEIEE